MYVALLAVRKQKRVFSCTGTLECTNQARKSEDAERPAGGGTGGLRNCHRGRSREFRHLSSQGTGMVIGAVHLFLTVYLYLTVDLWEGVK